VPFPGTAPAINALLGGHVTAVSADYPTVVSQLQSGAMRALVTASPARVEALPDVPPLADTGVSKDEAEIFYGIMAPAKTPPAAMTQLTGYFSGALKDADMKPKLAKQGLFPVGRAAPHSAPTCRSNTRNMPASFARRASRRSS
jgi:tripartite-type tricarboxylate transporter receptor subunit TctC